MRGLSVSATSYRSPLHQMACTTPTAYWNDSCSPRELRYALEHGAVGATSNPVIVGTVLQQGLDQWREPLRRLVAEMACATEDELAWRVCERVTLHGARLLEEIFSPRRRSGWPHVDSDRPALLPRRRADGGAGGPLRRPGAQPDRQAAGDRGRPDGDRGGHLPRHQHQRDGLPFPCPRR